VKHLLIYEAFQAKIISSTINFLKDKAGNDGADKFKVDILNLLKNFDILVDSIKEDEIVYISAQRANKIESEKVDNKYGIKYLKFWFSLDSYLGYTSTGNLLDQQWQTAPKFPVETTGDNKPFTKEEIDNIKRGISGEPPVPTGVLTPTDDYYSLETGQEIMLKPGGSIPIKGIFYKVPSVVDEGIYILHNSINRRFDGNSPEDGIWSGFGNGYAKSWSLGYIGNIASDHSCLHIYSKSAYALHIGHNRYTKWLSNNNAVNVNKPDKWSKTTIVTGKKIFDNARFAVVIEIDKIISNQEKSGKSYSGITSKRKSD